LPQFLGRPKKNEVTREWRKLHNEALNDLYSTSEQYLYEKNEMGRASNAYVGEERRLQGFGAET